jgi:hypothetical protein
MSKLSSDPTRKKFIKLGEFNVWECKDYKTFYMTIRKQETVMDASVGRDPNKYCLATSASEIFDEIDSVEEAMKLGYKRSDELWDMRLDSTPYGPRK